MYNLLCSLIKLTDKQLCPPSQRPLRIQGDHPCLPGRLSAGRDPPELDLYFTHEFHVTLQICFLPLLREKAPKIVASQNPAVDFG